MSMVLIFALLSGCSLASFISSDTEGNRLSEDLLVYLENDDDERLKSMFCEETRSSPTLDEEIQEALLFFDGKIANWDDIRINNISEEVKNDGELLFISANPYITQIETTSGQGYTVKFYVLLVNSKDEDKVGISKLLITSEEGEQCQVGAYLEPG